ncbi:MAG: GxxExxY protein [Candidatus Sumerlaeota bacterium]
MGLFNRDIVRGNSDIDPQFLPIIDAAREVHAELGPGFDLSIYSKALGVEMLSGSIRATDHPRYPLFYKDQPLEEIWEPAWEVDGEIAVEVVVEDPLLPATGQRMAHSLKMAGRLKGLLLNFGSPTLEYRRFVSVETAPE